MVYCYSHDEIEIQLDEIVVKFEECAVKIDSLHKFIW